MSGGMNLNQAHRDLVGDAGFFKSHPITPGLLRTLARANIAATAGADLVTFNATGALKLTAAQTYTSGNVFLYVNCVLPLDAVPNYRHPAAGSTVLASPDFILRMLMVGASPTARTLSCALVGTNPALAGAASLPAFTTKTVTDSLAAVATVQAIDFPFTGLWTGSNTIPLPGAMMEFAISPDGDIDQDITIAGIQLLYRANAAISDMQLRQTGNVLVPRGVYPSGSYNV